MSPSSPSSPAVWQPWTAYLIFSLALVGICWLALLAVHAGRADTAIYMAVRTDNVAIDRVAKLITRLGSGETLQVVVLAAALVLLWHRRFWRAAFLLALTIVGDQVEHLAKTSIGLPRPPAALRLAIVDSPTFPSGHAADATIAYLSIAILLTSVVSAQRWPVATAIIFMLLIGVSRVVLGVHWPTDVLAGWIFGVAWSLLWCSAALKCEGASGSQRHSVAA